MSISVLLAGPTGAVRDLVGTVLAVHGLRVEPAPAVEAGDALAPGTDVVVLVSPGPREWELAAGRSGVVLVTERRPAATEVVEAVLAGADAIVHRDASAAELMAAVTAVAAGGTVLDPLMVRRLAGSARQARSTDKAELALTRREQAILESAERGESVKQTARSLGIAAKTVENLQSRLFRKLGARNRAHAVTLAHHFGLLAHEEVAQP